MPLYCGKTFLLVPLVALHLLHVCECLPQQQNYYQTQYGRQQPTYQNYVPVPVDLTYGDSFGNFESQQPQNGGQNQQQQGQQSANYQTQSQAQDKANMLFDSMKQLGEQFRTEVEPLSREYNSLWDRFVGVIQSYAERAYTRIQSIANGGGGGGQQQSATRDYSAVGGASNDFANSADLGSVQQKLGDFGNTIKVGFERFLGSDAGAKVSDTFNSLKNTISSSVSRPQSGNQNQGSFNSNNNNNNNQIPATSGSSGGGKNVQSAFQTSGLVPDLLDRPPRELLTVGFDSFAARVDLGNELRPAQTARQPQVLSWPTKPGRLYTVVMTDPAPGGRGEWVHWLVANIPGTDLSRGQAVVEYVPSGPPPGTGFHRYTFLVFEQPSGEQLSDNGLRYIDATTVAHRGDFVTRDFATRNGLGAPVAGNFFVAQCDSFVPQVYAQLGQPNPGECF